MTPSDDPSPLPPQGQRERHAAAGKASPDAPPPSGAGAGTVAARIRTRLVQALAPAEIEIADDSARHAGHAGARPGGESHFTVRIIAAAFQGLSRIERHRRVHALLAEELAGPVHALSLVMLTPDEAAGPEK